MLVSVAAYAQDDPKSSVFVTPDRHTAPEKMPVEARPKTVSRVSVSQSEDGVITIGEPEVYVLEPVSEAPVVEEPAVVEPQRDVPKADEKLAVIPPKAEPEPEVAPAADPAPTKKKAKPKKAKKLDALAMIPPRKPYFRKPSVIDGQPISKEEAIAIALFEAPPAKNYEVFPRDRGQGLEYAVLFRTEDGAYEVVIDALSGKIVESGSLKPLDAHVLPGHLPLR